MEGAEAYFVFAEYLMQESAGDNVDVVLSRILIASFWVFVSVIRDSLLQSKAFRLLG